MVVEGRTWRLVDGPVVNCGDRAGGSGDNGGRRFGMKERGE